MLPAIFLPTTAMQHDGFINKNWFAKQLICKLNFGDDINKILNLI